MAIIVPTYFRSTSSHLITDVRDINEERRNDVIKNIKSSALEISERRGVHLEFNIVNQDPPAECSDLVIESIESASKQLGLKYKHMISRAYHDALFMARFFHFASQINSVQFN